ncbi:MAG TPA: hypothetical protein VMQ81_01505 [Acidimicrobiia bacterium]|nr:hypothetical protein [Acidimicrobiia bacterium]
MSSSSTSCGYAPWQSSADFRVRYEKVWDDGWTAAWAREGCPGVEGGIWIRADLNGTATSAEVEFSRMLAADPNPVTVRRELDVCRSADASSCQYVTRAVYRNLKTFDDAGTLDKTIAAFKRSPSPEYDQALLSSRSDGDWYDKAAEALFAKR